MKRASTAYGVAFAIAALLLAVVYVFAWLTPSVGLYHDDGVYLTTAKALAEGKGYRIISLPHEIAQTKYPFLFPALLSIVWRLAPEFPRNVAALKALPLVCAFVWFVLAYKLLIRLCATRVQAFWIVLLTAAAPQVVFFSTNLMSETLFAGLLTAALIAANRVERSDSDALAWVAGVLAALAFLTRTAGVAVLGAIPVAFALRRRLGAVWRFLLSGSAIACVWPVWVHMHPTVEDPTQLYYSFSIYSSWNILTHYALQQKVTILLSNVLFSLTSPAQLLDLPASMWLVLLTMALLIVLFVKRLVPADVVHLSTGAYMGTVLCWAWPPARFIAVILPLVLYLIWRAVEAVTSRRAIRLAAIAVAGLVSCVVLAKDIRRLPQTESNGVFLYAGLAPTDNWGELQKVFAWLRENTRPDAVILANLDPAVFLYTGRRSVRDVVANPYSLFYSPGSEAANSGTSLEGILNLTEASYLVVTPDRLFAEATVLHSDVARYLKNRPGKLARVERPDSDPEYQIYRIVR